MIKIKAYFIIFFVTLSVNSQIWNQKGIDLFTQGSNDRFGTSVDMNSQGNRIVVGAFLNDFNGDNSGMARVYEFVNDEWTQLGEDILGETQLDFFGFSVAINSEGNRIIVGAPDNEGGGFLSGNARVFDWNGISWNQIGQDINGVAIFNHAGRSVAINLTGDVIAIGADGNDSPNGQGSGHARVFKLVNSDWIQVGNDLDGEMAFDDFGGAISLNASGSRIAIGGIGNDFNGENSGNVIVYDWDGTQWNKLGDSLYGTKGGDLFGGSVSLNDIGDVLAVGIPGNDSGQVKIFELDGQNWNQKGESLDGEFIGDQMGSSVSLNSNGNVVIIGAPNHDKSLGSNDTGQAMVYRFSDNKWSKLGNDIEVFFSVSGDELGTAVSINSIGDNIIVGAPFNSGEFNFVASGFAKIYTIEGVSLSNDTFSSSNFYSLFISNPFTSILKVESENLISIKIYSVQGKLILKDQFKGMKKYNLDRLSKGLYLMNIDNTNTIKLVKN